MKKAFRKYGLLVLILFTMSLGYQYHKVLFLKPQSIHQWRQADCLSITKNYEESLNFFQAEIHNFISDGESSGKTAGEFPALYYFMGVLWRSEEHTSELQSRPHLVCRLLLEKKKP